MMVELRKRKAAVEAPAPAPKKANSVKGASSKPKETAASKKEEPSKSALSSNKVEVGNTVGLDGFGGEFETNDGEKTTLKKLVDDSEGGVVLFTYPKASTPGCTTQVCLFRDSYKPIVAAGFSVFGLSRDSPKANTTFKTKQNLPYSLLCDSSATLIGAIGMKKAPSGTTRGVFVINKEGKILVAEAGGPAATLEAVKKILPSDAVKETAETEKVDDAAEGSKEEAKAEEEKPDTEMAEPTANGATEKTDDAAPADVAAEVADSAETLDAETKV